MKAVSYKLKSPVDAEIYALLGVPRFSNQETCEKGYKSVVRNCHPDRSMGDADTQARMTKKTIQLNNAIACIRNPAQKFAYDEKLLHWCKRIKKLTADSEDKKKENANTTNKREKNKLAKVSPPTSKTAYTHDPASTGNTKKEAVGESRNRKVKLPKKHSVEEKKTASTHTIFKTGAVAKVLAPLALLLTAGSDISMAGAVSDN
ncbi:DnaJ domain-containing protein [bacterium]|nr:DnaJ domain-containing protein [bacterium]